MGGDWEAQAIDTYMVSNFSLGLVVGVVGRAGLLHDVPQRLEEEDEGVAVAVVE